MDYIWTCRCCGKQFDTLPLDFAVDAPHQWLAVPEAERVAGGYIDSNICVIDGKDFYIRGCLEIPVAGATDQFVYGVWVSVSEKSFRRIRELWNAPDVENEPPFFAWLCNSLSLYPETQNLKTNLHLRSGTLRPTIELEPTDHPLAIEQRTGITMERVLAIVQELMPRH